MQIQDFNTSRLSEWQGDERNGYQQSYENVSRISNGNSEQVKKMKHIPMSKLSYKYIFIKRENQMNIYTKKLPFERDKTLQNQFYQLRQNYEEEISKFIKEYKTLHQNNEDLNLNQLNGSPQNATSLTRKGTSQQTYKGIENKIKQNKSEGILFLSPMKSKSDSKKLSEGGYFFNNWRSYENYFCAKAISSNIQKQSLISRLVYSVLDMDYDLGLKIIDKINSANEVCFHSAKTLANIKIDSASEVKQIQINVKNQKPYQQNEKKSKSKSHQLTSLKIILKGLKIICSIIKYADEINQNSQLSETFFNRQQFNLLEDHYLNDPKAKINLLNINNIEQFYKEETITQSEIETQQSCDYQSKQKQKFGKKPSYNLNSNNSTNEPKKILKSTQNLINYKNLPNKKTCNQQWKKFISLPSKYQKICILNNLMFLINFAKKIKIESCQNDYYKLLFSFLKNGRDQLENVQMQKVVVYPQSQDSILPIVQHTQDDYSNLSQSSHIVSNNYINYKRQIDYLVLLLQLKNIKIYDRINFATRLLSKTKKVNFVNDLQTKIIKHPYLDNLLVFTKLYKEEQAKSIEELHSYHCIKQEKPKQQVIKKNRKNSSDGLSKYNTLHQLQKQKAIVQKILQKSLQKKQEISKKMRIICQNYIDEYGDLATIAYLSNQYNCLSKFYDFYRQSLLLSYEDEEVQKLDALKQKMSEQLNEKRCYPRKVSPFLSQINFRQQRVNDDTHDQIIEIESKKCQICNLKLLSDRKQCYIECNKCKHGGHFDHIIKWYSNYQNCPNVNCPCLCN